MSTTPRTQRSETVVAVDAALLDMVPKLFSALLDDTRTMRCALEEGDFESIRSLGHAVKGCGGGYGFEVITRIGADIERAALSRDHAGIHACLDELNAYVARIEVIAA